MTRHAKEKTLDFYYLNSKKEEDKKKAKKKEKKGAVNTRPNKKKNKVSKTKGKSKLNKEDKKEELFDFDNEIVIGVNVLPDPKKDKLLKDKKQVQQKKKTPSKKKQINTKTNNNTKTKTSKKESKPVSKKTIPNSNQKQKQRKKKTISEKELQRRQKRVAKVKLVLKGLLFLAILIGAISFLMISPIFNITEVQVNGCERLTNDQIISLSGIEIGENSFRILHTEVENNIKQNAYVKTVDLKRKLPNKMQIIVEERHPTFMIELGNSFVYVNNQGYLLEIAQQPIEKPILRGLQTTEEQLKPGNRLCEEDLGKVEVVLKIMEAANSNEIASLITIINVENPSNYTLSLENKGKTVYLGNGTEINERIFILTVILEKEEGNKGEIFLEDLDKVFFRQQV